MQKPLVINNKFGHGETVYILTDIQQLPRMVVMLKILPGDFIVYQLQSGTSVSDHYDIELSSEPNIVFKTQN